MHGFFMYNIITVNVSDPYSTLKYNIINVQTILFLVLNRYCFYNYR